MLTVKVRTHGPLGPAASRPFLELERTTITTMLRLSGVRKSMCNGADTAPATTRLGPTITPPPAPPAPPTKTVNLVGELTEFVPSETTTAWVPLAPLGIVKLTVAVPLELVVPPEVTWAARPPTV